METAALLALQIVVLIVMGFGLLGLLTTIIPGLFVIWLAALIYLLATGLTWVSGIIFAILTVLMIGGSLVDNVLMGASARQTGAGWLAITVSLVAGLVASLVWSPIGGLVISLAALFIVEFARLRDWRKAFESTRSMAAGCGWSVVIRFAIGLFMILLWGVWTLLS